MTSTSAHTVGTASSCALTVEASFAAQRAFNVWRGDKMSHGPVTLLRAAPGKPWLRIEGFVTPAELLQLYRKELERAEQSATTR